MELPIQDADRDRVIAGLRAQHAAGRLGVDELNRRVEVALNTTDPDELTALTDDLPPLASMMWAPNPNQQVAPYQAPGMIYPQAGSSQADDQAERRRPMWWEFERPSPVMMILILVVVMGVLMATTRFGGTFWILLLVFPMWSRFARQHRRGPVVPPRYQPGPPRIQDRYHSDRDGPDEDGPGECRPKGYDPGTR